MSAHTITHVKDPKCRSARVIKDTKMRLVQVNVSWSSVVRR